MAFQSLLRDGTEWDFNERWIAENRNKKRIPQAQYIGNALVAMIGISKYDGKWGVHPHLPGVEQDVTKNVDLWHTFFNYDMNILTDKEKQHQKITLEDAQQFFENIQYSLNKNDYDSLIVILSGHGIDDALITADKQEYKLSAIQDIFNAKSLLKYCNKPKLFIVDLCRGQKLAEPVDVSEKHWKRWKGSGPRIIHPDSDINIVFSNTRNYKSLDDKESGSVMMPCLSDVVQTTDLTKHHWTNIVTMLSEQVANKCSLLCVQSVSTISYLIYFQKRTESGYLKYFNGGKQVHYGSNKSLFALALDGIKDVKNTIIWSWRMIRHLPRIVVLPLCCVPLCCGIYIGLVISSRDSSKTMVPDFAKTFNNSVFYAVGLIVETMQNIYHSNVKRKV